MGGGGHPCMVHWENIFCIRVIIGAKRPTESSERKRETERKRADAPRAQLELDRSY